MKSHSAQSATSLPRAPRDEASSRFTKYAITMSIRTVCFILMAVIHPYGWWTWALAVGAIFLPYVAVILANVGQDEHEVKAIPPERALSDKPSQAPPTVSAPGVIQIHESMPSEPTEPATMTPAPPAAEPTAYDATAASGTHDSTPREGDTTDPDPDHGDNR